MITIREYIDSAKAMSAKDLGESYFVMWRRKSRPKIIKGEDKRDSYICYSWFTLAQCLDGEIIYEDKRYA